MYGCNGRLCLFFFKAFILIRCALLQKKRCALTTYKEKKQINKGYCMHLLHLGHHCFK